MPSPVNDWNSLCPFSDKISEYESRFWTAIEDEIRVAQHEAQGSKLLHVCKLLHKYMELGLELKEETRIWLLELMINALLRDEQDYDSRHILLKCMTRLLRFDLSFGISFEISSLKFCLDGSRL
jgi:hypothetical protein